MTADPIDGLFGRWSELDTDWQGVLVGAAIVAFVEFFGVSIPW